MVVLWCRGVTVKARAKHLPGMNSAASAPTPKGSYTQGWACMCGSVGGHYLDVRTCTDAMATAWHRAGSSNQALAPDLPACAAVDGVVSLRM